MVLIENAFDINGSQIKFRHHCWKVFEFVKFGYSTCKGDSLPLIQEYSEYNYTDLELFHVFSTVDIKNKETTMVIQFLEVICQLPQKRP